MKYRSSWENINKECMLLLNILVAKPSKKYAGND